MHRLEPAWHRIHKDNHQRSHDDDGQNKIDKSLHPCCTFCHQRQENVFDIQKAGSHGGNSYESHWHNCYPGVFWFAVVDDVRSADSQCDGSQQLVGRAEHGPDGADAAGVHKIGPG